MDGPEHKEALRAYATKKGALAFGVADATVLEKISPEGHGPSSIMPKARSAISIGIGGPTQGAWDSSAKTMGFIGSTEAMAYSITYGLAFFIESRLGYKAVYCPPDLDPEFGSRIPMQSLKLHAEVAGIGARSMAGDILLHPEFGMLYYGSVFTDMPLEPDAPLAQNPCPASSCVKIQKQTGQTPCQKFCPVQCLSGDIDEEGKIKEMVYESHKCAEMSQQYDAVSRVLGDAMAAETPLGRESVLYEAQNQVLWYKLATGASELFALCYECMRVCPINTQSPGCTPLKRGLAKRGEE